VLFPARVNIAAAFFQQDASRDIDRTLLLTSTHFHPFVCICAHGWCVYLEFGRDHLVAIYRNADTPPPITADL